MSASRSALGIITGALQASRRIAVLGAAGCWFSRYGPMSGRSKARKRGRNRRGGNCSKRLIIALALIDRSFFCCRFYVKAFRVAKNKLADESL